MSVTVTKQIQGQQVDGTASYCYLYEPLPVFIVESDNNAKKIFIDIELRDTGNGVLTETLIKYAEYDINPGVGISVDLMKIAQQINDAGVYNFGTSQDVEISWEALIGSHKYYFKIYSDLDVTPSIVYKIPIMGNRSFEQFQASVPQSQVLTEFDYYGLDFNELKTRWTGVSGFEQSLANPTSANVRPTITRWTNPGDRPCGGYIIWKSRFGGWMHWAFDIQTKSFSKRYSGNLEVGMFESTKDINGLPYIPVNYTGIQTSYSITMKSLELTQNELLAVSGIQASPAVYYVHPGVASSERFELMRLTSYDAPISTLAQGGTFSVTLKSISAGSQLTI